MFNNNQKIKEELDSLREYIYTLDKRIQMCIEDNKKSYVWRVRQEDARLAEDGKKLRKIHEIIKTIK